MRWTPLPAGVDCASFSNTFPPLAIAVSLSQSRKVCPQVRPLVSSPFNGTNVRGNIESAEAYSMENKFRETTYAMDMSIQGSELRNPFRVQKA